MFETIDFGIRAASIGVLILLLVHFFSIRPFSRKSLSAITLLIGAIGVIVGSSIMLIENINNTLALTFIHTSIFAFSPAMIAWGLLELFEDDFQIQTWQIVFVIFSIPTHYLTHLDPIYGTICNITSLMIYGYLFYITIKTATHDLVEARCKFRFWFMGTAALSGLVFTLTHLIYGNLLPANLQLFQTSVYAILTIILAYWALNIREQIWVLPQNNLMKRPEALSPAETALLTKLQASMKEDIWREEGLTIRKLANLLESPEHRLRKVINQGLGYRNFAAFVNEHRIGAACEVLADPVKADVPVITIAYDVGYASLGPFNRAFKDIVGESPTEYRKRSFSHV